MDIKTEIKRCREESGWSKHQLSLKLDATGDYIGKVEAGAWDPSLSKLRQMAALFREAGHPFSPALEALLGIQAENTAAA